MLTQSREFIFPILFFFFVFCSDGVARACTLWGAAGDSAAGGGVIVAKNRDWQPQSAVLRVVVPDKGHRFLGMFPVEPGKKSRVVAGINERGLTVASATAGSIPRSERDRGTGGLSRWLLTRFDSVDAVLKQKDSFSRYRPGFFMIADNKKIALIEIAPEGGVSVSVTGQGYAYHTNHYTSPELLQTNRKIAESSRIRYGRIALLLQNHAEPFTMNDFIAFSEDRNDGPDNSIMRAGSSPKKTRTLAVWIVSLPAAGNPSVYVKTMYPGVPPKTLAITIDENFWKQEEPVACLPYIQISRSCHLPAH